MRVQRVYHPRRCEKAKNAVSFDQLLLSGASRRGIYFLHCAWRSTNASYSLVKPSSRVSAKLPKTPMSVSLAITRGPSCGSFLSGVVQKSTHAHLMLLEAVPRVFLEAGLVRFRCTGDELSRARQVWHWFILALNFPFFSRIDALFLGCHISEATAKESVYMFHLRHALALASFDCVHEEDDVHKAEQQLRLRLNRR